MLRHPLAADECRQQENDADAGRFSNLARANVVHPHAHQQRNRNRCRNSEEAPGTVAERIDDHQRQHGEQDDHDGEDGHHGGHAGHRVDLFLRHLAERLAVAPDRGAEDDHVLHGAAKDDADNEPQSARQEAELRRQRRADERAGARDGGEMMSCGHPLVGGHEVAAVVQPFSRRGPAIVQAENGERQVSRVEAIGHQVGADPGDDEPRRADRFAAREREHTERGGAERRDGHPDDDRQDLVHGVNDISSGPPQVIAPSRDGVVIDVRVIPRARRSGPAGVRDGALLLRIQAPPVEGAANAEVIDILADLLGVPHRAVSILSGHHSRRKRVAVTGIDAGCGRTAWMPRRGPSTVRGAHRDARRLRHRGCRPRS